jgi:hypothetical protein
MEAKITTASDQQGWANPNPLSSKSKFHFFGQEVRCLFPFVAATDF